MFLLKRLEIIFNSLLNISIEHDHTALKPC